MARRVLAAAAAVLLLGGLVACSGVTYRSPAYSRIGWHGYYGVGPFHRCCRDGYLPVDPDLPIEPGPPIATPLPIDDLPGGGLGGDLGGDFGVPDIGGFDFD